MRRSTIPSGRDCAFSANPAASATLWSSSERGNTGPYCRVRCWTKVWQTPQDWLKRRNPSRWVSLNDASGGAPCAKAPDADATTNAAARNPRGICRSSDYLQPSHELDCTNLTPWGGGVERGRGAVETRELGNA